MAELVKLKKIRGGHRTPATKLIEKAVNNPSTGQITLEDTQILLATITKKVEILEKCDSDILEKMAEGDDFGTEIEDSSGYMDRLIEAKTKLELTIGYINEKLAEDRAPKPPSQETKPTTKAEDTVLPAVKKVGSQIKLPKIVIKEYGGSLLNWSNFWGKFNQSVDKQEDLSDIQKFTYLKSYLVGDAERAIRGLSLNTDNYKILLTL